MNIIPAQSASTELEASRARLELEASFSQLELEASLSRLGLERVSFRAGQVLQYQDQTPLGYYLPVRGTLRTVRENPTAAPAAFPASEGLRMFPALGDLERPLPYRLEAQTDLTVLFVSRFNCQPGAALTRCLEDLNRSGNPLFQLWSHHVTVR